jgi:hypothetical protein
MPKVTFENLCTDVASKIKFMLKGNTRAKAFLICDQQHKLLFFCSQNGRCVACEMKSLAPWPARFILQSNVVSGCQVWEMLGSHLVTC